MFILKTGKIYFVFFKPNLVSAIEGRLFYGNQIKAQF